MPFFLKPCLKLRRKKNKKKQNSDEIIKRVSDITVHVTTEEIYQDCGTSSSASNVSENADLAVLERDRNITISHPSSSQSEELSLNESISKENEAINSERALAAISRENVSAKNYKKHGTFFSINVNKRESNTGSLKEQSVEPSPTLSDAQVDDIDRNVDNIQKNDFENPDVLSSQDRFSQSNDVSFYDDINDINVNTNVFRKIEELRKIESSLNHGDQTLIEQIDKNSDKPNIDKEVTGADNKYDDYLKKQQNTDEDNGGDEISKPLNNSDLLKTPDIDKRKIFNISEKNIENMYQLQSNIDEKDKETPVEYTNYDSTISENCAVVRDATDANTASLKQRKNNLCDIMSFTESSSFQLTNNLIESKDGVVEAPENESEDFHNECLDVKENSEIDFSPRSGSHSSDPSPHHTNLGKCTKSSSKFKNENTYSREEVHDYFRQRERTGKSILLGIYSLNNKGNTECNENVETGPMPTHSSAENLLSHDKDIIAKRSEPRESTSGTIKRNIDSDNDCNGEGIDTEILLGDSQNRGLIGGQTEESNTKQKDLHFNYEEDELSNYHETCNLKHEIERNEAPLMKNGRKTSLHPNKKTTLKFQEVHDKSFQINEPKYPPKLKEVNAIDNNGNILVEKKGNFDLEDVTKFKILHKKTLKINDKHTDEISYLNKDFDGQNSVKKSISSSKSNNCNNEYIASFSNKDQNNPRNTYKKPEIFEKNNRHYDNEIHPSSDTLRNEEYPPYKDTHEVSEDPSTRGINLPTKNTKNFSSAVGNKPTKDKKTSEYTIGCKYPSTMEHTSRGLYIDTACSDKSHTSSLVDILNAKECSRVGFSTSPCQNSDFIYFNDNYQVRYSTSKISTHDNYHQYDNNRCTWEKADKTLDFEKEEFIDYKSPKSHRTESLQSQNLKSSEFFNDTEKERFLEEYSNNNTDVAYERYFASENMQSPKSLNRFSNISSASESSRSSRFSENEGSKEISVKKRESRSFSISACGDSGNDEKIDETTDILKSFPNCWDAFKRIETRLPDDLNVDYHKKHEHKLTISITKKKNIDAIRDVQNIASTKHSEDLNKNFKSLDSNEIIRRKETIEIFNKKKMQALSDMKHNIRVIPVQNAETIEISSYNVEKVPTLKHSQFLKFSLNSHASEVDKNLEELMPVSLLDVNKNTKISQTLHHSNSVGKSLTRENTDSVPTSESETDSSSQHSEQMTPVRKRLLEASREIRSPKLPFRSLQRASHSNAHYLKRPVIIRSPKLNLVAYLTKNEKNVYQLKKGYRMYNHESGNYKIISPEKIEYRQSDFRRHPPDNAVNNRATSPEYLKPKFDDLFKRYARKGRSNGELISYKRSTEWLQDAGIIGKALTAEEAINAFKCTAGVKVALNKGDYRHYLKKLARIKRLNYNEIYKRLCSPANKYIG